MSNLSVWECTFTDDDGETLYTCHDDFDWSHIAESVDDSDLVEVKDKTISFGEFDAHANGYLSQLVDDLLREKGIEPASFGYSIEVDYTEVEDE